MSTEGPGGNDSPIFHSVTSRKPKKSGPPAVAIIGVVVVLAGLGLGGYFLIAPKGSKGSAPAAAPSKPWILPEGTPSMAEAETCLRDHEIPCAEADMLAYLKQYPNDAHANALLAITLTQDGRHKEALYFYRKAEGLGVGTYDFYAGYGKSLDAMGDLDGAMEKNRAALKIVPNLVDVRGLLAEEMVRKGQAKEAVAMLEQTDRKFEAEGSQPYFTDQIDRIKKRMGGDAAKEVDAKDAPLQPTAPGQTLVKGQPDAGTLSVPVSIDGAPDMDFTVDSGASLVSIPSSDADPFIKTGLIKPGDYRGQETFQLADGRRVTGKVYLIHSLKVGGREVKDVLALIYQGNGPRLLGQSFLKRFKSWSIDNGRRVLVLQG